MSHCQNWISNLSALLTPTIAVAVGLISYRQWKTAQNKLKFDLFEKRILVFNAASSLIMNSHSPNGASQAEMGEYLAATNQAKWLLSDKVDEYLREVLYKKAINIKGVAAQLSQAGSGPTRIELTDSLFAAQRDIFNELNELHKRFAPFLKLLH